MTSAVLSVLLLAGCGGSADKPPAAVPPSPTALATPSPTWSPPADPAGVRACDAIKKANASNAFDQDLTKAAAIAADGFQSSNTGVKVNAQLLDIAVRGAQAGSDPLAKIKLGTAAINLETACTTAGYYPKP